MKKIAIYTFWNIPNYGTFMQAYALQKAIANLNANLDVQQIAYIDKVHYNAYYKIFNMNYRLYLINPHFYKNLLKRVINYKQIQQLKIFLNYYKQIPHTKNSSIEKIEKELFDVVVLGSDIIWDYSIDIFNQDVHLFGNGFNAKKIIAYAPSFGTIKSGMKVPSYVTKGLKNLDAISVRDENSANLVQKIAGGEAQVVIDPTFLVDFWQDENIKKPELDNYIVVYGSSFTDELISGAQKYAHTHQLKLVCLSSLDDTFAWCDINVSQQNMTPFEWCGYFKHAAAVFTCTYHGLIFGLIFNKRIIFSPTQFILDKASSLIDYLELEDVLIKYQAFKEKADWSWNYTAINQRIDALREKSYSFLRNAIVNHE